MKYRYYHFLILMFFLKVSFLHGQQIAERPVRLAVAGITHGHSPWILGRKEKTGVTLVGIFEPNSKLADSYALRYHLDKALFFSDLNKMLEAVKPEAVVAFGPINAHRATVEACAPRGIHVMVEKPLATSAKDAKRMAELAKQHQIYLLTNYETSWYPSTEYAYRLATDSGFVGNIRKAVFHHGHQGPKEIGVSEEFFNWLTDPVQNGGGALTDFGCYGANIMTYLMRGITPVSVTAITQHFKPAIYPKVEDEATIVVTYPNTQCIIQASWNWPFSRKDMEVYGDSGYIITIDNQHMRVRNNRSNGEKNVMVTPNEIPVYTDPFSYFADVIRGKISVPANSLYSIENNVTVVGILEAALESARIKKAVPFKN
jgi:predicted dehydrogenase